MKVSFLVTYYNQKQFVRQSIESILKVKKFCDWEILVGDDGSDDGTVEIVEEYIKQYPKNIRLFIMKRKLGEKYDSVKRASENRLNLLSHMEGDYFCILDGDDFYCDIDFIEDAMKVFSDHKDLSVVAFGYTLFQNEEFGEAKILPSYMKYKRVNKKEYLERYYLPAGACVHKVMWTNERIEYIKQIGYFDDNDILINSLNFGEMYCMNRAIYAYRQTGESVYTSMSSIEQAVLNVQGLDVDVQLINDEYRDSLYKRNASSIIEMYLWKKRIEVLLGKEKYERYYDSFCSIKHSFGAILLSNSISDKKVIQKRNRILFFALKSKPKSALKHILKYFFGFKGVK